MRRRRRGPDALLTAHLDTAWAALAKANRPYCERCGRRDRVLNASHIVARQNRRLRWDVRNSMTLCALPCHAWWHDYPLESAAWILDYRPEDVTYLTKAKNEIKNWTPAEKKAMLKDLRDSLALERAA